LVQVLEIPLLLLLILATRELLGGLFLLLSFRSITASTCELSAALSRWGPGSGLRRWRTWLASLNRGCCFRLFSGKFSSLTLLLDLTGLFLSLATLFLFFHLEKSRVII
jgi:hypothetical protein